MCTARWQSRSAAVRANDEYAAMLLRCGVWLRYRALRCAADHQRADLCTYVCITSVSIMIARTTSHVFGLASYIHRMRLSRYAAYIQSYNQIETFCSAWRCIAHRLCVDKCVLICCVRAPRAAKSGSAAERRSRGTQSTHTHTNTADSWNSIELAPLDAARAHQKGRTHRRRRDDDGLMLAARESRGGVGVG